MRHDWEPARSCDGRYAARLLASTELAGAGGFGGRSLRGGGVDFS